MSTDYAVVEQQINGLLIFLKSWMTARTLRRGWKLSLFDSVDFAGSDTTEHCKQFATNFLASSLRRVGLLNGVWSPMGFILHIRISAILLQVKNLLTTSKEVCAKKLKSGFLRFKKLLKT